MTDMFLLNWEKPLKNTFSFHFDWQTCSGFQSCTVPSSDAVKTVISSGLTSFFHNTRRKCKKGTIDIKIRLGDSLYRIISNKDGETNTKSESMCALISQVYLYLVVESSGEYAACVQQCGRFLCLFPSSKRAALPLHSRPPHTVPAHRNTKHQVNTEIPQWGRGFTLCKPQERKTAQACS